MWKHPEGIVAGPDGALWFTESSAPLVRSIQMNCPHKKREEHEK
jgi:streptogramin lyase